MSAAGAAAYPSGCMTLEAPSSLPLPVAVIVPHLDRLDDTAACCRSLAAQRPRPARILVVDNGSTAHSETELAAACPDARILRLPANRGFAGGVNAGLRDALADASLTAFWVLNNDTTCPPDTLAQMQSTLEADPRIGLVGSPLREGHDNSGRRIVPAGRRLVRPWAIPWPIASGQEPDYLTGASLLIRRNLLDDIGLFDEGFFFFFEDADFCRRAHEKGWRLAVASHALVDHRGSSTIRHMTKMQARCYRAGHVRYLRKHSRHPFRAALPPFLYRLAADALTGQRDALRGTLRGWHEGWQIALPTAPGS